MTIEEVEKVVRIASEIAIREYQAMEKPRYITLRQAKMRYKGFVKLWEAKGLVKPIPSESGKPLYEAQRLENLFNLYKRQDG